MVLVTAAQLVTVSLALAGHAKPNEQVGIASTFLPVEPHNNGRFACTGRTPLFPKNKMTRWTDHALPLCAHRTIPCGTWVLVENVKNGLAAWCVVGDRGPYGAKTAAGGWVLKTASNPDTATATYRGVMDLGPAIAKKLKTGGWAKVRLRWWPKPKRPRILTAVFMYFNTKFSKRFH